MILSSSDIPGILMQIGQAMVPQSKACSVYKITIWKHQKSSLKFWLPGVYADSDGMR